MDKKLKKVLDKEICVIEDKINNTFKKIGTNPKYAVLYIRGEADDIGGVESSILSCCEPDVLFTAISGWYEEQPEAVDMLLDMILSAKKDLLTKLKTK